MKKPDSNLSPDSQPWARAQEDKDTLQDGRLEELESLVAALMRGDGGQAGTIANVQAAIKKLQFETAFLYGATGNTYPPGSAPPAPPAAPVEQVHEDTADWSRTWGSSSFYTGTSDRYTHAQYLYQGQNPENKVGMWRFELGPARGRQITGAQMFMQNIDAPWSQTFVAQFGTHGNVSAPAGKPGRENAFDVGWSRGEGKWLPIPDWAWNGLSNGSIQGFTVGAAGPSDANSAFFMGVGQAAPPVIRVTYI